MEPKPESANSSDEEKNDNSNFKVIPMSERKAEPYSNAVARFVRELKLTDVPEPVIAKAKLVFLDTLGIALASSTMDFGHMVVNVAQKLGGSPASSLMDHQPR